MPEIRWLQILIQELLLRDQNRQVGISNFYFDAEIFLFSFELQSAVYL